MHVEEAIQSLVARIGVKGMYVFMHVCMYACMYVCIDSTSEMLWSYTITLLESCSVNTQPGLKVT